MSAVWIGRVDGWAALWGSAMGRAGWQGGLAVLLVWGTCRTFSRISPRERCWLWRLAYLKWIVALLWATPVDLPVPIHRPGGSFLPSPAGAPLRALPPEGASPEGVPSRGPGSAVRPSVPTVRRLPASSPIAPLLLLWIAGSGWCAFRVAREWHATRQLRRACQPVTDEGWIAACAELSRCLGLSHVPRLLVADGAGSPLLAGIAHPAIILPSALLAGSSRAEAHWVLAHELAHLKRHDLSWSWLAAAVHTLFFWHPLVWLARREWEIVHEVATDALAVETTNAPAADYAEMLLKVATRRHRPLQEGQIMAGVLASYHTLKWRLIAMKEFDRISRRPGVWVAGLLVALAVALLVPWRVVAQGSISVELERTLVTPSVGGVWSVAFSPDGTRLASTAVRVVGPSGNRHPIQEADLWDPQTGELKQRLAASGEALRSVAFSPDGKLVAGGTGMFGRSGEVLLWDAQTGELKQMLTGHTGVLDAVAFSLDGKILASAGVDRKVRLWNAQTGTLVGTLADHRYPVYSVAFSPDSKTLASASAGPNYVSDVKLWDVQAGTVQQTLTVRDAWVWSVTFSPDGLTLATGSSRRAAQRHIGEVTLWDAHTGQLLRTLTGQSETVSQVAFSPDGKTVVSGGVTDDATGSIIGGEISLWDSQSGQLLWAVIGDQLRFGAVTIAFSPDGTRVASGDASRTVRIWRIR